tara:strand:+ start:1002 stop:1487 length:486 start_codon:yes stop_codon:yes gene_type:complete
MWDTRKKGSADPFIRVIDAHRADIHSINFNPHHEFVLATGSADECIKIWDMRNTSGAVHRLDGHSREVFQIQWAPFDASLLASCGADRRVRVWDLTKVGMHPTISVDSECPEELLFIHGGHNDKVSDISWNPMQDWVVASVSDDNILQVWQMVRPRLQGVY